MSNDNLSTAAQAFIEQHGALSAPDGAPWLIDLRGKGLSAFSDQGLPTQKLEDWKYTSLQPLDQIGFTVCNGKSRLTQDDLPRLTSAETEAHHLVFHNGHYCADLSNIGDLPTGVRVINLADNLTELEPHVAKVGSYENTPVLALNTAYIEDGYAVLIDGVELTVPIEILYISEADDGPAAYHPRNIIVTANNSRVTILERHIGIGDGICLANHAVEVSVASGSRVKHFRSFEESAGSFNLSAVKAEVGRDAAYESFVMSLGGKLGRSEIDVALNEPGAETKLNGVYLADHDQHVDHTTNITHNAPHTTSQETYKGALDGKSRAVFQGAILVAEGADKADGRMSNKTLLLSDDTEIDSKPQLEIYADDVKCAHGSTAGELDEEALFYLRSRGLPENQARALLVVGFLSEVVEDFDDSDLADLFKEKITRWLKPPGKTEN